MDSSESARPMKVPEDPVIQKILLTPCTGVLEQQGSNRDLVVYGRDTTFGGFVNS
jgi:hypothetical protein